MFSDNTLKCRCRVGVQSGDSTIHDSIKLHTNIIPNHPVSPFQFDSMNNAEIG